MLTEYTIKPSKLENQPIIDGQCHVDFTSSGSGYFCEPEQIDKVHRSYRSTINDSTLEKQIQESDRQRLYRFFYKDNSSVVRPELEWILSRISQNRQKRETEIPCKLQNMQYCKTLIDFMRQIVSIANNSMPYLQALQMDTKDEKSKFMELYNCLRCKNDSITFVDESGPENVENDQRVVYSDQAQFQNNIDVVTKLLDDKSNDNNTPSVSDSMTNIDEIIRGSTLSVLDDNGKNDSWQTRITEVSTITVEMTDDKPMFTEAEAINATTKSSSTSVTEESVNRLKRIDDVEQSVAAVNVTAVSDGRNVTEIAIDTVHPSVHPSDQGHTEQNPRDSTTSRSQRMQEARRRIIPAEQYLTTKKDVSQVIIPTAETIKSTQQLQLTPTMSWMPYQVCFYGPPPGGPGQQSAPGQMMYPATSPGTSYPMPPQRGYQNSGQPPNFVQVQAQTVQFLPQSQPGNSDQRMGPSGPETQNFPMFPGYQPSPSSGAGVPGKPPYYCTYIPAPTFQFPPIPGVSEYQRSSDSAEKNDRTKEDDKVNGLDNQKSLMPENYGLCPFNTIRCRDGRRCILRSQWCDGQVDCYDASDESMCSCRERISQERLCDGYFDCPHGEDELGCLGCPKTSFSCNDWRTRYTVSNCVPLSQRCDGITQCPNGKDEIDCNILTPTYLEGRTVFTVGYTEGYLHKNYKGQWYPVCSSIDSWAEDACVSEIGSEVNEKPEIKIHTVPENAYQGPYVAQTKEGIKLIPSCLNTAVYVRCPRFPCGTRVFTRQDSLRPNVLENEDQRATSSFNTIVEQFFRNGSNVETKDNEINKENDTVSSQLRVVGGRASQPKAWPFLVAIYKDGKFYCGGVILNELWVSLIIDPYMGHYFEIQAGMLRRFSFAPMAQSRKARYTVIHPQYDSNDMRNDIGMIMLDDPLRFNRWVRPVCLPEANILGSMWRHKPEAGSTCIAIGWGATREFGPDPDHLREVEVPILDNCKHEIDQNEAVICAGYPEGGRDACQGDSGGPLMCKNPYSESQWYVAGIVSHGEGCARPEEPGAYTKVSHFQNWIRDISSGQRMPPLRRTPLEKCPGFSCEGGLGKCLPIEARCNRLVDCLDGEDELNCPGNLKYPSYKQLGDPGSEINSVELMNETSTVTDEILTSDTEIPDVTTQSASIDDQTIEFEILKSTTEYFIEENNESSSMAPIEARTTFTCSRFLQTIPINKRCNRIVDCEDNTDEKNCTCKDFLLNLKPTAICDGYVDCDDQTDEKDCQICAENEFFCKTSRTCIDAAKMCDGNIDCEFMDDEKDCFALSNGQRMYLDADGRPYLNTEGVLTRFVNGKWRPSCQAAKIHQNQSTVTFIGQKMCTYFGFANLQSSKPISVRDAELETVRWSKESAAFHDSPSATSLNSEGNTCLAIYMHCRPVLSGSKSTYRIVDAETGNGDYLWPWLTAIFVDGSYRCSAVLLDRNWLLAASKCVENVRQVEYFPNVRVQTLNTNYTTAMLGYGPLFRYVDGPHQQITIVDEIQPVNGSVSVLLHLKHQVNLTRHVQPLFLEKKIYLPGVNDTCVAVGTDEDHETKSISLRPVLQNCQNCQRCFVNTSISECSENKTSDWSGTIFCLGKKGWYPTATFEDDKGPCDFRNVQNLTSIDHINPYLMEALDGARSSIEASCDGFRCPIGQCIPENRVCDGVPDCRDQADEDPEYCSRIRENCDNSVEKDGCNCLRSELRCGNGKCVDKSAFCDGTIDCADGSDEPNICTCAEYLKLTNPGRLCDGVRNCLDKTDESPELCPCRDNSFKCMTTSGSDTCIPQDFVCDDNKDCINGEDESVCRKLKLSLDNNTDSGEVIRRSYGVWHTECFPEPITSQEKAFDLCKSLGYTYGEIKNNTMISEKPMVTARDNFYMVKINDWTWITLRDDKPLITLVKPDETCHRAFVTCA
ncbi:Serine protease nudel [Dufourea novaeangliae]|uniref:Serine protease nudel n=1 Tax=Dufourea novaeangliae TaxID=178035 RepID=A0A154P7W7_DUFNO|nr:Serine protease nudel [Dufourea novaeangliae]